MYELSIFLMGSAFGAGVAWLIDYFSFRKLMKKQENKMKRILAGIAGLVLTGIAIAEEAPEAVEPQQTPVEDAEPECD